MGSRSLPSSRGLCLNKDWHSHGPKALPGCWCPVCVHRTFGKHIKGHLRSKVFVSWVLGLWSGSGECLLRRMLLTRPPGRDLTLRALDQGKRFPSATPAQPRDGVAAGALGTHPQAPSESRPPRGFQVRSLPVARANMLLSISGDILALRSGVAKVIP